MSIVQEIQRRIVCLLLVVCISLSLAPLTRADESVARQTFKVAVLNSTTYADRDADGVWRGLDIEAMIAIAQKAGFDLEFIDSTTDPDFLGNLDTGAYDIVADVVKTPEREKKYLFTDQPIGYTSSTLAVRSEDLRWDYGNVAQLSGMKIGVLASYANNAEFRIWCTQHQVKPTIREYENIAQMTAALFDGEIDAEVYTAVYSKQDAVKMRTLMKFLPESFYYAFRKDDAQLKNRVDTALTQILAGNIDYLSTLKNKYEEQYDVKELPLSTPERQYVATHPILTVAVIAGDGPYYKKDTDGSDSGIIPDYYALVEKKLGIKFEYKSYTTQKDAITAVKKGEADILGIFNGGLIASQQYGLALTDRLATVNNLILTRSETGLSQVKRIAVKQRPEDLARQGLTRGLPKAGIQSYENAQKCFASLEHGETSAVFIDLPSATWLLNQTNTSGYSITPIPGATSDLCGAVDNDNLLLCSILDKQIGVTRTRFNGIVTKNTLPRNDWRTVISRLPPSWTIAVISTLFVLVIGLTWVLLLLWHRQQERAALLAARAETEKRELELKNIQKHTEERNQFFANISHDMRTPLNAVVNFIRLAQDATLPRQEQSSYLEKAESSSLLLLDLINDTLTVSKLSSDKLQLQLKPCRMRDILEAVSSPIQELAGKKKIQFSVNFEQIDDCTFLADRLNLEKIFLNLLTNAVKYTPDGGHIQFITAREKNDSDQIHYAVTIRDDGIGISKDFLPHLFEPFAQEKRQGYESVGTGLGLSIVSQLVNLMGGTIDVTSRISEGTTFIVRLSFSRSPDTVPQPSQAPKVLDFGGLQGKKVLLCEDNPVNREIANAILGTRGITVVNAENGRQGVDLFAASAPKEYALVLMDIRMPVMNGYEATKALRALPRPDAGTIPIIAMTADAFEDDVKRCLDAGMNSHLAKPINPELMLRTILEHCTSSV